MSRYSLIVLLLSLTTACATTGATFGSGVGDAMLSRSPWYAGVRSTPVATPGSSVGIAPITYQKRQGQGEIFDPAADSASPMAALLAEMNAYVDSLRVANGSAPIRLIGSTAASRVPGVPPDVRFGCLTEGNLPGEDCVARGDSVLGRNPNLNQMQLAVGRPSPQWISWFGEATTSANVQHALVITIEVGEYLTRQTGLGGAKSVDLGSNHVQPLPWLTSLEQPVQVIQLTGALVGRDGKALRIGAEGIVAKRTRIVFSGFGVTELITNQDVETLRTARREDMATKPLAWKEALQTLVRELTR